MFFKQRPLAELVEKYAEDFVHATYRGLLERDADRVGLEHYVKNLREGGTIPDLLRAFTKSEEFLRIIEDRRQSYLESKVSSLRDSDKKIAIFTNCQGGNLGRCIQALTGAQPPQFRFVTGREIVDPRLSVNAFRSAVAENDIVLLQPLYADALRALGTESMEKVMLFPSISFPAFQPDQCYVQIKGTFDEVSGPLGPYHSSIAFYAWRNGMSATQAADLFCTEVYEQLRFYDYWDSATEALLEQGKKCSMRLDGVLKEWRSRGCFMHSPNHPKLFVIADVARWILDSLQIPTLPIDPMQVVWDNLADVAIWPVYPEIAKRLGIEEGSYLFKGNNPGLSGKAPIVSYQLEEFIDRSFSAYDEYSKKFEISCSRAYTQRYRDLFGSDKKFSRAQPQAVFGSSDVARSTIETTRHPYSDLPARQFWKKAVRNIASGEVDPVGRADFLIAQTTRVATAGSCFAQHISNRLQKRGFNYLVTETAPSNHSPDEARRQNYGVYSARYGNLYTPRQLLQLFDRAYGDFVPTDDAWKRADGCWVDPFRPEISPEGFSNIETLRLSREQHLEAVRRMFETLDVFIFTLGLTEAWRSRNDGAVFPLAPGVVAGEMDPERYEFVNFGVADVIADLGAFVERLTIKNPLAKVMLTVSPVPLAATYEDRHVLTATTYSKSVLRVAAEDVCRRSENCSYFPSYEIVTGNFNRGAYYDSNLRSVNAAGVDHVMRLFFAHYAPSSAGDKLDDELLAEAKDHYRVVCEEDRIAEFAH